MVTDRGGQFHRMCHHLLLSGVFKKTRCILGVVLQIGADQELIVLGQSGARAHDLEVAGPLIGRIVIGDAPLVTGRAAF